MVVSAPACATISRMRETGAVFLGSLLVLAWGAGRPGIATAYVDPVAHVQAQDEALYAASSLEMARHGGWMTPRFLDRYALYKPPVLYWLSAICIKIGGPNALAIRFPSILAGAGTVALVFAWVRLAMPWTAALTAALLLLSNHLFFVMSRTGLTDALLVFEMTLALYAAARDPKLDRAASRWIFGIATGAAIMTKALAGLLPLIVLVFCGVPLVRFAQVSGIAAAVALPWHAWQLYAHPRWFWAEYVLGEHVTWGFSAPQQSTSESHLGYYAKRLFLLDPVVLFALFRIRSRIVLAWTLVILASVLVWRYRNVTYLAPLVPAMAIAACGAATRGGKAAFVPPFNRQRQAGKTAGSPPGLAAPLLALAVLIIKIFLPNQPFGIPFAPESTIPSESALDAYAAKHRGNDLIIIDPDDQFYSAALDLPRVRYLWLDPSANRPRLPLDFEYLGITVTAGEFTKLNPAAFAARLREWNLDSTKPIATAILAQTPQQIVDLIAAHPEVDFFAPMSTKSPAHAVLPAGNRVFLLSRVVIQRP